MLNSVLRKNVTIGLKMDRKENSLDPAGFVFGGPSNVMEFHGVGSIMPKFSYKEDVEEIENPGQI